MSARVLVIEDDPSTQKTIVSMLDAFGHTARAVNSGEEGLEILKAGRPDLLLLDLNLPNVDGMEVLREAKQIHPNIQVIFFSGSLSVDDAVEAMKLGAFHCLTKPFTLKEFEHAVNQALSKTLCYRQIRCEGLPEFAMVVASTPMQRVNELVQRVSQSPASSMLIMGETGTGKEVVARHLHHLSSRSEENFVAVNCAAIPESLIESELFGHERGAFTDAKAPKVGLFEESNRGTLFLDELGELPLPLQSKLLRVLQERVFRRVGGKKDIPFDARIIAATNQDLPKRVKDGTFREDLYYRLNVIPLLIPPLRKRREDIVPLAEYFIQKFCKEFSRPMRKLTEKEKETLLKHDWPGNVRELKNAIERAILLDLDEMLQPAQSISGFMESVTKAPPRMPTDSYPADDASKVELSRTASKSEITLKLEDGSLANAERSLIMKVMEQVHGNKNQAATILGINRTTLYRKLESYGVDVTEEEFSSSTN